MDNINEKINTLYKILENHKDENTEVFKAAAEVMEILSKEISDLKRATDSIKETVNFLNDDVSELQDQLFEEVSIEDLEDISDNYDEIECKNCGKKLYLEMSAIKNNDVIKCPDCGANLLEK